MINNKFGPFNIKGEYLVSVAIDNKDNQDEPNIGQIRVSFFYDCTGFATIIG